MKKYKKVLLLILCIFILLPTYIAGFAAADPEFRFEKLMSWNGDNAIPNAATTTLVNSLKVKEFDGENVIQVLGRNAAGEPAAGRQINYWTLSDNKSLGKRLSFKVYIPEMVYYVSLRGCYTRYESETISGSGNNIGYNSEMIFASNLTTDGYVTTVTFNNGDTSTIKGEKKIKNGVWHTVDIYVCDKVTHLYIDGDSVGTAEAVFDKEINEGFDHAFKGFQVLPGKNGSTDVPSEDAGLYLKNILLTTYDCEDESFVGSCTQDGNKLTVTFSETPANGQDVSGVAIYNTETGEKLSISTPVISDSVMTIDVLSDFLSGTEYVIDMPDGFKSVRGTDIYADIYFIGTGLSKNIYEFEEYPSDIDVTDEDGNVTSITSAIGDASIYKNFISAVSSWPQSGLLGFEKQGGNTVLTVRNTPTNPRLSKDVRFGIITDEVMDLSKGPVTGEFDIMIPKLSDVYAFDIMPYSYNTDVASSPEIEVNYGGMKSDYSFESSNIAYSMLQAPSVFCREISQGEETSRKFNTRADGKMIHQNSMDGNQNYYHSGDYTEGTWVTLKFVISKISDGTYNTDWYYNGTYFGNQTNVHQKDATDYFRGIRFGMYYSGDVSAKYTDIVYIDNFTVSQSSSGEKVVKVRIINRDGERFAMLSKGVSATAAEAEVYFGAQLDYSGAVVSLEDKAGNVINTTWTYDATDNKLVAVLDSLLRPAEAYTVKVTGLKTASGSDIGDYSASFTTSEESEFVIDLEITDANGVVIKDVSGLDSNERVYVKAEVINTTNEDRSVMFSIATYADNSMKDMDAKEFMVSRGEKLRVGYAESDTISALVKDVKGLLVGAYAWETFTKIKPRVEAVIIN